MVTRSDLRRISQLVDEDEHLLSLYLPLFQETNNTDSNIALKNLLRTAEQRFQHEYGRELPNEYDDLFEDIRVFIRDNAGKYGRGISLFATPTRGIILTLAVPGSIESSAIVWPRPNLTPLIRLVEDFAPYGICLISRDQARILLGNSDNLDEHEEIVSEDVPGQHDQGGWSQARFERHIEDHVNRHFKRVAQRLFDLLEAKQYEHLILAGPEEVVAGFDDFLHQYVQPHVIGDIRLDMDANINEIRDSALRILHQHITNQKQVLIGELEDKALARDNGVQGLDETLKALQRGQVLTLIVDHRIRMSGVSCQACGALSVATGPGNTCPYCQSAEIRDTDNVIPGLITSAFQQGARISVIDDDEQREHMAKLGGIGALLRFRVEEQTG